MNTPKKFRVWLPSLNKFGDDNSVLMDCYGKLYGVTRPSLFDGSRSIVNIGQFKEIDGYTIQWYTGLTDSKGNPIYEGDIVKDTWRENRPYSYSPDEEYDCETIFEVKYNDYSFNLERKYSREQTCVDGFHREVIGNIFEHSDLLK